MHSSTFVMFQKMVLCPGKQLPASTIPCHDGSNNACHDDD
jgi:hypothetical protein